jgi:hypothetical protein
MDGFSVIKRFNGTLCIRKRTVHNFNEVSGSRGHQNLLAVPQTSVQTNQVVSMRVSNYP